MKSVTLLTESLADPVFGPSFSPEKTAFNMWSGYPKSILEYWNSVRIIFSGARRPEVK